MGAQQYQLDSLMSSQINERSKTAVAILFTTNSPPSLATAEQKLKWIHQGPPQYTNAPYPYPTPYSKKGCPIAWAALFNHSFAGLLLHNTLHDAQVTVLDGHRVHPGCKLCHVQLHATLAQGDGHLLHDVHLAIHVAHSHLISALVAAIAAEDLQVQFTTRWVRIGFQMRRRGRSCSQLSRNWKNIPMRKMQRSALLLVLPRQRGRSSAGISQPDRSRCWVHRTWCSGTLAWNVISAPVWPVIAGGAGLAVGLQDWLLGWQVGRLEGSKKIS